jgi:hypothetical protein
MFMEKNPGVMEMLEDGGAQVIMKMTNCDYIYLADKLVKTDINEIINGVLVRSFIAMPDAFSEDIAKKIGITYFKSEILKN